MKRLAGFSRIVLEWLPVVLLPLVLVSYFYWVYFSGSGTYFLQKWQMHSKFLENRAVEFSEQSISPVRLDLGVYCALSNRLGLSDPSEIILKSIERNHSGSDLAERLEIAKSRIGQIQILLHESESNKVDTEGELHQEAIQQFRGNWAETFDDMKRENTLWRELWDSASDADMGTIEENFELEERIRVIENYASVARNDPSLESKHVTAVQLLSLHAGILWRKPSLRDEAARCLTKAEELRSGIDFSSDDFLSEASVALARAYARMGNHDRALQISQGLGGTRRLQVANEAMVFELNQPFSNDRLNRLTILLNSDRLFAELHKRQEADEEPGVP